jgi:hypothetical protein
MTPSLNIISARSMLAVGQPKRIAARQKESKSVSVTKPALRNWRSVCRVGTLFETFVGVFVVFYLFAVIALAGALLFYTFKR